MATLSKSQSTAPKSKKLALVQKASRSAEISTIAYRRPIVEADVTAKVAEDIHTYQLFAQEHELRGVESLDALARIDLGLRRHGIEGENAFLAVAAGYLTERSRSRLHQFPIDRALNLYHSIGSDGQLIHALEAMASLDPFGRRLSVAYQFFLGRKFREGSGKFFTPQPVANAMAKLLPLAPGAVVMDPTCGGGTFLIEASERWRDYPCRLIGNDVDTMLAGLTELVLSLAAPLKHSYSVSASNLYDPNPDLRELQGQVTGILANPPFSLPLSSVGYESELFKLGYRTSDAIFLDVCLDLLRPNGSLVCLLPHSIIANAEYETLRRTVEKRWELCGVVTLPEGVFYLTGNTSARADIVHLKKRKGKSVSVSETYFSNAPSVGLALNSRRMKSSDNALNDLVSDPRLMANTQNVLAGDA